MKLWMIALPLIALASEPPEQAQGEGKGEGEGEGIVALHRTETTWVTVVAATPASPLSAAERLLFAALLETPEAWPAGGALVQAHERGATISAESLADGVLWRIDGHADDAALLIEAVYAGRLLPRPTSEVLARAQGTILSKRRLARGLDGGQRAIWRRWFGDRAPSKAQEVSDIALHQVTPRSFWAHYEPWSKSGKMQVFAEGKLHEDTASIESPLQLAEPAILPVLDQGLTAVQGAVVSSQALIAHPLPPSEATPSIGLIVEQAIALASEEGAEPIDVEVLSSKQAALLVLKTALRARPPAQALDDVRARLHAATQLLTTGRADRPIAATVDARLAGLDRSVGDRAWRLAHAWLTHTPTSRPATNTVGALLFADALRMVVVHPLGPNTSP